MVCLLKGAINVYDDLPPWGHSDEVVSHLLTKERHEYEALLRSTHRTPAQRDRMHALWERAEKKWWTARKPTGYSAIQVGMQKPKDWKRPNRPPRRLVIRKRDSNA